MSPPTRTPNCIGSCQGSCDGGDLDLWRQSIPLWRITTGTSI